MKSGLNSKRHEMQDLSLTDMLLQLVMVSVLGLLGELKQIVERLELSKRSVLVQAFFQPSHSAHV